MTDTRKSEIRYTTDDPRQMLGKWTVRPILRRWKEDFHDTDSGEIVTVERSEVIIDRGTYIDQDTLQQIRFYMQEGSVSEVEVSNQNRKGVQTGERSTYIATASVNGTSRRILTRADNLRAALLTAEDYIELNFEGTFTMRSVKRFTDAVIIDADTDTSDRMQLRFYQITVSITDDSRQQSTGTVTFVVRSTSVDAAMQLITADIQRREQQRAAQAADTPRDLRPVIKEARPVAITHVVPEDFSSQYDDE